MNPPNPPFSPRNSSSLSGSNSISISVHNVTATISLNSRETNLIPAQYLRKADASPVVQKKPWIFRSGVQDGRQVDLSRWSRFDIRYRGVFQTLKKVPNFKNGLFEDVGADSETQTENVSADEIEKTAKFQDQVVYALLSEVLDMMDLKRVVDEDGGFFYLRPRLLNLEMEYLTGYREKYNDAPITGGFVSLDFHRVPGYSRMILPVSTTKEKESPSSSLKGCFKLLLAQLALNIQQLRPPGDKLPDQEVFLIFLHGSRLYILRGFFPGRKTSHLWCGKSTPGAENSPPSPPSASASPILPPEPPPPPSTQFDIKENINRLEQAMEQVKLTSATPTPASGPKQTSKPKDNPRTFHLHTTKAYNLWLANDFHSAIRTLTALHLYSMSGTAKCGFLQKTFDKFPFAAPTSSSSSNTAGTNSPESGEGQSQSQSQSLSLSPSENESEAEASANRRLAIRAQHDLLAREQREERRSRARARARARALERWRVLTRSTRTTTDADSGWVEGFGFADNRRGRRRQGWDWVWENTQAGVDIGLPGQLGEREGDCDEDVILNSTCMSGRPD